MTTIYVRKYNDGSTKSNNQKSFFFEWGKNKLYTDYEIDLDKLVTVSIPDGWNAEKTVYYKDARAIARISAQFLVGDQMKYGLWVKDVLRVNDLTYAQAFQIADAIMLRMENQ